jgi:predicted  nucleic acid-binding Zn-ribbon protein
VLLAPVRIRYRAGISAMPEPLLAVACLVVASLRDDFQHFYAPSEDALAAALRTGLVSPDTNVLLSLYRIQSEARDDLFRALERLEDRLWIPHQVGLEFHRRRLSVIDAQEKYFGATREELNSAVKAYIEKVKAFSGRIALTKEREQKLETVIRAVHKMVVEDVDKAEASNNVKLSTLNTDDVLTRLEDLLVNKVGAAMDSNELGEARKEALRRVEAKIPPGYMDKAKADPTGDYLVWTQLKKEASRRKLPTVFITDDRKEDWYRREHGMTLGARLELREEMQTEAGVPFLVMTTETFLLQAKKHLDVAVSPQTVDQAKDLPDRIDYDKATSALYVAREAVQHSRVNMASLEGQIAGTRKRISEIRGDLERLSPEESGNISSERHKKELESALVDLRQRYEALASQLLEAEKATRARMDVLDAAEAEVSRQRAMSDPFPVMDRREVLQAGDRVNHRKFGLGVILSVRAVDGDSEYQIRFDDQGYRTKAIVHRYAPMVKI